LKMYHSQGFALLNLGLTVIGLLYLVAGIKIHRFLVERVIGASTTLFLEQLVVFLTGVLLGLLVGGGSFLLSFGDAPAVLLMLCSGVMACILLVALYNAWTIGITPLIGAVLFGIGIHVNPEWWILFSLIGLGVQTVTNKQVDHEQLGFTGHKPVPTIEPSLMNRNLPDASQTLEMAKLSLAWGKISLEEYNQIKENISEGSCVKQGSIGKIYEANTDKVM
jgi:hypothetical protein